MELFQAKEIVEIGKIIEENGEMFYNYLKKTTGDRNAKKIFEHLENEEKKHWIIFDKLGGTLSDLEPAESYSGEHVAYMRAMADKHVFTKKNAGLETAKKMASPQQAVEMALRFEHESVELFNQMRKFVPVSEHKIIDRLVEEEKNHVVKLEQIQKTLGR